MFSARALLAERPPIATLAHLSYYRWLVVGTVCVGAFLGQLDASIAGLILPTLEDVFDAPVAAVEWVAISYLLTLAALVVPFGRLADLVGRKTLYTGGFFVFVVGSALCSVAADLTWLIVFRVVQAIGAAFLQANSVAIITAIAPRGALGKAIGIQGAAQAVGLALGPSVGGFLIVALGWQWVFLIAVPFGLLGMVLGVLILPQTPPLIQPALRDVSRDSPSLPHAAVSIAQQSIRSSRKDGFDWPGALLFGPIIGLGLLILTFGNSWGWLSRSILIGISLIVVLVGAFISIERRSAAPLIDIAILRNRIFSTGLLAGLLSYAVLFGVLFLFPFYLERVGQRSPAESGLLLTPIPVALGVIAPFSGLIADRFGSRLPTAIGMLIAAIALLVGALVPAVPATILVVLIVLGIGLGLFTPANNSAIMGSAPLNRLGVAGGLLNMTRSLGTSLGIALTGLVLTARMSIHSGGAVERTLNLSTDVLAVAFRDTLLFLTFLAFLTAAISLVRGKTLRSSTVDRSRMVTVE